MIKFEFVLCLCWTWMYYEYLGCLSWTCVMFN